MGLTKAQKEERRLKAEADEAALTLAAFRLTEAVPIDVPAPKDYNSETKGFVFLGEGSDCPRVEQGISTTTAHFFGTTIHTDKDRSWGAQGARDMYSTKLLALKALRHEAELDCARRLRYIDLMIEREVNGE